jgi:hypothetical protein
MKKRDELWQSRHFLLSSFVRLNIPIQTNVYRCIDNLIQIQWKPPLGSLDDVDREIKKIYEDFMNG